MSRIITDLPDEMDPVSIIREKMWTCPLCGGNASHDRKWYNSERKYCDAHGKHHEILEFLDKYLWEQCYDLECQDCGCKWDTGWYPIDHKMFHIKVKDEDDVTEFQKQLKKWLK